MDVSVSLMAFKSLNIPQVVQEFLSLGVDTFHIDISDESLDMSLLDSVNCDSRARVDLHYMCSDLERLNMIVKRYSVKYMALQFETYSKSAFMELQKYRDAGVDVGASVQSCTPLDELEGYASLLDYISIMSTTPGVAGLPFIEKNLSRIEEANLCYPELYLHVDGGVAGSCQPPKRLSSQNDCFGSLFIKFEQL